ncbi:MAG: 2-C-methyl-D-erythritol 2,4-cyclodiphosphate synthase [Treponema sp.]|nr:MAG: 2-C-methyl-D-erythritol 2,4-cyclodiphosphate synthase [Treponema sp.]
MVALNDSKIAVLITAAGNSTRFGKNSKKEYMSISETSEITVLSEAVFKFLSIDIFSHIAVVVPAGDKEKARQIIFADSRIQKIHDKADLIFFVSGGDTRQASVLNGIKFLNFYSPDFVLIHDGARPFVSKKIIMSVVDNVLKHDAVAPVISVTDTQKKVSRTNWIEEHLKRSEIKAVQTPQGFNFKRIFNAHVSASKDGKIYTDETEIFAVYEGKVFACEGETENKKITFYDDIPAKGLAMQVPFYKIGLGYDLHKLKEGRELVLGGVKIKSPLGCDAHSDGDVLLHAITDSLLGALGFSDIGELFPPDDIKYKNANSAELLRTAWNKFKDNWTIGNIDCVIAIESPKILPYRKEIKNSIADILQISSDNVFVKAKTGEGIGIIGNKQAVAVWVTGLIYRTCQTFPR